MTTHPKPYDQNLRLALEEIKAVLKKRDIMAFLHMGSLTHGEFYLHTDATWSVMKLEGPDKDGRQGIRIAAKKTKVGTKEHDALEATLSFVCNSADICNRFGQIFYAMKAKIGEQCELTHEPLTNDRISNQDRGLQ